MLFAINLLLLECSMVSGSGFEDIAYRAGLDTAGWI